jgi:hypothetical protein
MKKAIGTIVGSLIFILIILAVFSSIFFITNQMFSLFSNQITNQIELNRKIFKY